MEKKIPSKTYNLTHSERLEYINKIWKSPECKAYVQYMGQDNQKEAKKLLEKQPKEIQIHIKGAWDMKRKYGDIFREIALEQLEKKQEDNIN